MLGNNLQIGINMFIDFILFTVPDLARSNKQVTPKLKQKGGDRLRLFFASCSPRVAETFIRLGKKNVSHDNIS